MVNLTTKWGLPLFSDTDAFDPIQTPLGLMSTATEAGISKAYAMGLPIVASAAERNLIYPTVGITQGVGVYRSDLGYEERYYGLYNSTTNPGGRAAAGWAPVRSGSYRSAGSTGSVQQVATAPAVLNLPAGTWRLDAYAVFEYSTTSPRNYTVDIFNATAPAQIARGITSAGTATGSTTISVFDMITLTAPALIQLRVYTNVGEGTQLCPDARLIATKAELLT